MTREFCCHNCGLIWFDNEPIANKIECPECNNTMNKKGLSACDTFGYCYAYDGIVKGLIKNNAKIHYAKEHPYYNKIQNKSKKEE